MLQCKLWTTNSKVNGNSNFSKILFKSNHSTNDICSNSTSQNIQLRIHIRLLTRQITDNKKTDSQKINISLFEFTVNQGIQQKYHPKPVYTINTSSKLLILKRHPRQTQGIGCKTIARQHRNKIK